MTIGELAKSTDVHIETIRFYQRRGLLNEPVRPAGGIRRYRGKEAARIRFVKSAQKLGFSLDEVMTLLTLEDVSDCEAASKIAQNKLNEVRKKISDLRRMEKSLAELISKCHDNTEKVCCPIISSLQSQ